MSSRIRHPLRLLPFTARQLTTSSILHTTRNPPRKVPVDSLCIPLSPPYSIASYIPSPTPLSRATLIKLHKLASLLPPTTEEGWKELEELGGLVAIMDGVRGVDTSALRSDGVSSARASHVDGRVREKAANLILDGKKRTEDLPDSESMLKLAQVTSGRYYVVTTPEGIRGKKKSGSKLVSLEDES